MHPRLTSTLYREVLLAQSAVTAAKTAATPVTAASIAPATGITAGAIAATALSARCVARRSRPAAPLTLILSLPGKCVSTDVAKRRLHRVRLCGDRSARFFIAPVVPPPGGRLPGHSPDRLRIPGAGAAGTSPPSPRIATAATIACRRRICAFHRGLQLVRIFSVFRLLHGA